MRDYSHNSGRSIRDSDEWATTALASAALSSRGGRDDGWRAVGPRAGRLELAGEAEQGGLVAVGGHEVDADGEVVGVPVQRHRHGRVAGEAGHEAAVGHHGDA